MGRLIVIEGLDGSGKTTQCNLLVDRFRTAGKKVRALSFPCYGTKGASLVEMYLAGEFSNDPDCVNAYASSMFYASDRFSSYMTDWKKDFDDPDCTVIAARYTTANAYHQLAKLPRGEWDNFLEWLYDFEFSKLGLPHPDTVIMLSMPPDISSENVNRRSAATGQAKDIHEKDEDYLSRCFAAASYSAEKLGWLTINCAPEGKLLSIGEISAKIDLSLGI